MDRRQLLAMAAGSLVLKGQTKEFEAASIKPSAPGGQGFRMQFAEGGRVMASNVTVAILIQQAYGVREFQILGAPGWVGSDHYDITTVAEGGTKPDDLRPMMRALLADRFKLALHRGTKELPVYALVVGKGGPKFHASTGGGEGPGNGRRMSIGRGQIELQHGTMAFFASELARQLGRTVIDKTELTGEYDLKMDWTPDESLAAPAGGERPAPAEAIGPSIFTALQEQLGLKLESTKGPVEILVIDRVEKASEN
jgi:uncharacterized protein (TIGR03435 family)